MSLRVDTLAGIAVIAVGVFFLWGAAQIETFGGDVIESDLIPRAVSILTCFAGVLLVVSSLKAPQRSGGQAAAFRDFALITLPLAALILFYVLLWKWFGFLLATLLAAPVIFWTFGNRGWRTGLALPFAIAVLFYVLFFRIMGIFDAPGTVIDFAAIVGALG